MSGQDLHNRPTRVTHASPGLDMLLTSPDSVASTLDLDEILSATCKVAVEALKVRHSGLMVFDSDSGNGYVISEYPPIGTKGLTVPLRGVPIEELIANFKQPIRIPDISQDSSFQPTYDILRKYGIRSMIAVPLRSKEDELIGSLGLDMGAEEGEFTESQLKLCEVLATQAAAIIELYEQNRQRAEQEEQLTAIRNTALALYTKEDLTGVLDTITRQAVQIVGAKDGGISQLHEELGELTVIADYRYPDYIGSKTIKWYEGLAGKMMHDDLPYLAVPDYNAWKRKAPAFANTGRFGAVLMINLKWQNRTVGVLYINAERGRDFHREFARELPPLLSLLAGTAAMAIANSHLLHAKEVARVRTRFAYEASSALAALPDSAQVLQDIANQSLKASGAAWVRLILIDEFGGKRNFVASAGNRQPQSDDRIRDNGISMRVFKTGKPFRCEDTSKATDELNPSMLEDGSRAALCLPFSLRGRQLGVVWIHYSQPRKLSEDDEEALMAYLIQAAIAYDNAHRMEELEPLRLATGGVAAATTEEVLRGIVNSAKEIFHADYAIFWPYPDADIGSPRELPVREAITAGVDEELRKEMLDEVLPIGELTRSVMRKGWFGIPDIDAPNPVALPDISLKLLRRLGAKSLEGLGIVDGREERGILYLVYKNRRDFPEDEMPRARTFALHAAQALQKVKLEDQVTKAHSAAQKAVIELTKLGNLKQTLKDIAKRTKDVLECDAVTVVEYDKSRARTLPLTAMEGVVNEAAAKTSENVSPHSVLYRMLMGNTPYRVPDTSKDKLFRDLPFVKRERIKSVCAMPLKIGNDSVGVMFVNYRTEHRFSKRELELIALFAKQAAVTIRNKFLYDEQEKRLKEQLLLVELSKELLGATTLSETLNLAVTKAAKSLNANFLAIVLRDKEGRLAIAHAKGWSQDDIDAYAAEGKGDEYQAGHTIKEKQPVIVTDYAQENRFIVPEIVTKKKIKSGLSVRMVTGGEPVGAILAHYTSPCTDIELREWAKKLSLIANLTAISIQHHQALQSKIASLEAVQRASDEISSISVGTERGEVLDRIVEQAVTCLPQSFMGTIQLYDEKANELLLESIYPQEGYDQMLESMGIRRALVRRPGKRIGISGRAVLEKRPQLVNDVETDDDYIKFSSATKSELAVPLLTDKNRVLGVLNVESKKPAAFNKDDEQALLALAKVVVAIIQNAEQYRLLEKDEERHKLFSEMQKVDASSTLARLGMASAEWAHSVAGYARDIRDNLNWVRKKLKNYDPDPKLWEMLNDELSFIDEIAMQIREKPVTALLSFDETLSDVPINQLISDRVKQLWERAEYNVVRHELCLTEQEPRVRCSPDWIRRMLDILIDNAIYAMDGVDNPSLKISTTIVGNHVDIALTDSGPGIPLDIKYKLFRQRIDKLPPSKGLGTGLLMVQAIAQTYGGWASVGSSGPKGTTMHVRLPVVEHY